MSDKMMKGAVSAVLDDMGRAARDGRARRFQKKNADPVASGASADVPVDPVMSDDEEAELMSSLEVQR